MNLEYEDAGTSQQLNQLAQRVEAEAGPPEEWAGPALPPLPDVTSDAMFAALLQLQRLLHVEAGEASPEGLQRAHAMLESCVLPALAELAKQQQRQQAGEQQQEQQRQEPQQQQPDVPPAAAGMDGAGGGSGGTAQQAAAAATLAQYPLGFSTGDGAADLAATILRMLYIKDLRALQVSNCSAGCRCWLPLLAAAAGCRCWLPLLAAAAGCRCWLLLLAAAAGCRCWLPAAWSVAARAVHSFMPCGPPPALTLTIPQGRSPSAARLPYPLPAPLFCPHPACRRWWTQPLCRCRNIQPTRAQTPRLAGSAGDGWGPPPRLAVAAASTALPHSFLHLSLSVLCAVERPLRDTEGHPQLSFARLCKPRSL